VQLTIQLRTRSGRERRPGFALAPGAPQQVEGRNLKDELHFRLTAGWIPPA